MAAAAAQAAGSTMQQQHATTEQLAETADGMQQLLDMATVISPCVRCINAASWSSHDQQKCRLRLVHQVMDPANPGGGDVLSIWLSHGLPFHDSLELLKELQRRQMERREEESGRCCPSALMHQRLLLEHGGGEEALELANELELTAAATAAAAAAVAGGTQWSSDLVEAAIKAAEPAWLSLGLQSAATAPAAGLLPVALHSLPHAADSSSSPSGNDGGTNSSREKQMAVSLQQQIHMNAFAVLLRMGRLEEAALAAG
ncbi:hypothetical protein cyc_06510 [Cyclospora cayetanensis]|uniref:Uncharacterized protein n=1 Tax=Cyclospora cayetanensis TaxID=88456 RepID=A0A1D3D3L6_9EIME|nr:hypothetical protein cyc_06510 [Cyclospora cayetanensis]